MKFGRETVFLLYLTCLALWKLWYIEVKVQIEPQLYGRIHSPNDRASFHPFLPQDKCQEYVDVASFCWLFSLDDLWKDYWTYTKGEGGIWWRRITWVGRAWPWFQFILSAWLPWFYKLTSFLKSLPWLLVYSLRILDTISTQFYFHVTTVTQHQF